jgi:methionine-S-sulfoxide reductase
MTKALFGAGCFWGVEEYFKKIPGVLNTKVGYSGGNTENPTYESVCYENTNHAEVIEIEFDTNQLSYEYLLSHFWKCHDPTTKDRQGPDIGAQYRSIIFYYNDEQKNSAEKSRNKYQKEYKDTIVTEIIKVQKFYQAEDYHQNYIEKIKNL